MQVAGSVLKAVGSVCVKSEETGDKHKAFVHVSTRENGDVRFEASNGAVVVQVDEAVDCEEPLACLIPKGTIVRLRAKDEVYVEKKHRRHRLHVEKETDTFERYLEGDDGNGKGLPEPYPDLDDKFNDLPAGSGGFDVHPDHLARGARILSMLKCSRATIRTSRRAGANYAYLVGYLDDDVTVRVAIGCLDMYGVPDEQPEADEAEAVDPKDAERA